VIIALLTGAFLIGSIPTGSLIASMQGIDLKSTGSGNIGATNVMRSMGKVAALLTLIGDMAKGAVMILLVRAFLPEAGPKFAEMLAWLPLQVQNPGIAFDGALGLSAMLGHTFSIFLKFRGGKGVATGLGVALVLSPYAALFSATIWLVTFNLTRYSSLGGIAMFVSFPLCIYMIDYSPEKVVIASVMAVFILVTHRANILRLFEGTENKFSRKT
jgi:acyl phosphate:glycerol-3-phosphate acyltransferase